MAYKTYIELVNYFKALPTDITALKSVVVGSDEEELNQQSSQVQYPLLRVDTPEIVFRNDNDNQVTRFNFRLYVLTHDPLKTNAEENTKLSTMATLAQRIHKQLWDAADDGLFDMVTGDKQGDAVRHYSGDNVLGWWFPVVIELWVDECA